MGPRLFGRGNQYIMGSAKACAVLQWGHAFSDVETRGAVDAGKRPGCFNGATPFRTWKQVVALHRVEEQRVASMGPRLFRRGNRIYVYDR